MRSAILFRMAARSVARSCPRRRNLVRGVERQVDVFGGAAGTSQKALPVTGVMFSKYWPFTGATHSPPIQFS
jgi:hypothetical protein